MLGEKISYRLRRALIFFGLASLVVPCAPVLADETDPFQVDTGHWMSFERYQDNIKRNRPVGDEAIRATPKIETPTLDASQPADAGKQLAGETPVQAVSGEKAATEPAIAPPLRPIELPLLPGVNNGFSVQVDSTEEFKNSSAQAQIINNDNGESDLHLQEQNWQDAAEIARQHANEKNGVNPDDEHTPLNVRMTFLPNPKITPIPSFQRKPRLRALEVPATPVPKATAPKAAECLAVDQYKKKQLEAIQSDRQTLEALQSAINDLGLQKQLNFMTGAKNTSQNVSAQSPQTGALPVTATP